MMSAPGSDEIKRVMLNCTDCHTLQRIFESRHTEADFLKVFERMAGYYPGASDLQPQRLVGEHRRPPVPAAVAQKFAEYLASINLNGRSAHPFEIKQLPRPKGRATKVVITEYDLPRREIQPHDVVVDPDGMVWFSHFGEQFLSKMDPKTGKTTDYPIPVQKPDHPKGTLDLEVDQDGDIWVGLMYQTGLARFDRKTETFRMYPIPKEWQRDATQQSHFSVAASKVDGKAWVKNSDGSQIMRLDIATGEYENLGTFRNPRNDRPIGIYGIYADQQNNCYILEFPARRHRQDRRQDRQALVLPDADALRPGAARPGRRAEPAVVRRIRRQRHRHVRSRNRNDYRIPQSVPVGGALRRRGRPQR